MCGICGYQGNFQQGLIHKMAELIAHRGPDDHGFWEDAGRQVALGHTRLSIIDLRQFAELMEKYPNMKYELLELRRDF